MERITYDNAGATAEDFVETYGTFGARREVLKRKNAATTKAKRDYWSEVIAVLDADAEAQT